MVQRNFIADTLKVTGIFVFIVCFIVGLINSNHSSDYYSEIVLSILFLWWGIGLIIMMLFLGLAEIIHILFTLQQRFIPSAKGEKQEARGHATEKDEMANLVGAAIAERIIALYEMQGKVIEEITVTPFANRVLVKAGKKDSDESFHEVVVTSGGDAINSPLDKHPKIKAWFHEKG